MTRNANLFLSLEKKDGGGQVTFGDNSKGKIMGIGKVCNTLTVAISYIILFWRPISDRTARMSGAICKLEWGVIHNSNNNKKILEKILEIKYNQVKWVDTLAMGNLVGSYGPHS